jgi:hypothetical protein
MSCVPVMLCMPTDSTGGGCLILGLVLSSTGGGCLILSLVLDSVHSHDKHMVATAYMYVWAVLAAGGIMVCNANSGSLGVACHACTVWLDMYCVACNA